MADVFPTTTVALAAHLKPRERSNFFRNLGIILGAIPAARLGWRVADPPAAHKLLSALGGAFGGGALGGTTGWTLDRLLGG